MSTTDWPHAVRNTTPTLHHFFAREWIGSSAACVSGHIPYYLEVAERVQRSLRVNAAVPNNPCTKKENRGTITAEAQLQQKLYFIV